MKVLAIFTCYNRRELTRQSMELLGQNKNVTFDYVIVNDGSTDGTDEMLAAMPYSCSRRRLYVAESSMLSIDGNSLLIMLLRF